MTVIVQGLLLGGLYCAAALGLSLVFGVMRMVNLAHGQVLVCGALLTAVVVTASGADPILVGLATAAVLGLAAWVVQRFVFTPVLRRGGEASVPATFAVGLVVQSVLLLTLGSDPRVVTAPYATASLELLGIRVRASLVIAFVLAVVMTVCLHLLLTRSRFGAEVRASAADPDAAEVVGIDVGSRYAWTFAIATVMTSLGGSLVALSFAVDPVSGLGWLVRAFTVVVLGGLGSIPGTLVGAIVVGLAETTGAQLFGPQYRDVVVFGLLVVILLVRPTGLASLWSQYAPRVAALLRPRRPAATTVPPS